MAQLDVEKKKGASSMWWIWVLIAIAAIVILWFVFDDKGDQDIIEPVSETAAYIDQTSQFSHEAIVLTSVPDDIGRA